MGDFNVSCGASGISMSNNEVVLVPLVPTYRYAPGTLRHIRDGMMSMPGSIIVSNEGCRVFFVPLTLPIFGTLDSYGHLENIEQNVNTECIEKHFDMSIDDFAQSVGYGDMEKWKGKKPILAGSPELERPSGMWVHRKIYDLMSEKRIGESGRDETFIWDEGYLTPYVLGLIGFNFIKEDESKERYDNLFQNKDFPTINIWSDETWIRIEVKDKDENGGFYNLKSLVSFIEKTTKKKFSVSLKEKLGKMRSKDVFFDEALDSRKEHAKEIEQIKEPYKDEPELVSTYLKYVCRIDNTAQTRFSFMSSRDHEGEKVFESLYGSRITEIKKPFVDFQYFLDNLFGINRLLMPTFNGYQYGNHYASKMVYQEALKIVSRETKNR